MIVKLIVLFVAGILAGFFNIFAGGGSTLTLPALIFLGLPPTVANGTNRIALLFQNISATIKFKKNGYFFLKTTLQLSIPTIIGALIGSSVAVKLPEDLFKKIISVVMILSLILILKKKKQPMVKKNKSLSHKLHPFIYFIFFLVGVYGGMIQAGVGFLIILALSLIEYYNLVEINSIKILLILLYTIPSLFIFFLNSKINIIYGLILAAGNTLGGLVAVHLSIKKGDKIIKVVFSIAVLIMAMKLLNIF